MTLVYLDTSAMVKLVFPEAESESLASRLSFWDSNGGVALVSSALTRAELLRAVYRRDDGLLGKARQVMSAVTFIPVSTAVLESAGLLPPAILRTLDAVHVASALAESPALAVFITYDKRLAEAAEIVGLPVESPGFYT